MYVPINSRTDRDYYFDKLNIFISLFWTSFIGILVLGSEIYLIKSPIYIQVLLMVPFWALASFFFPYISNVIFMWYIHSSLDYINKTIKIISKRNLTNEEKEIFEKRFKNDFKNSKHLTRNKLIIFILGTIAYFVLSVSPSIQSLYIHVGFEWISFVLSLYSIWLLYKTVHGLFVQHYNQDLQLPVYKIETPVNASPIVGEWGIWISINRLWRYTFYTRLYYYKSNVNRADFYKIYKSVYSKYANKYPHMIPTILVEFSPISKFLWSVVFIDGKEYT